MEQIGQIGRRMETNCAGLVGSAIRQEEDSMIEGALINHPMQ